MNNRISSRDEIKYVLKYPERKKLCKIVYIFLLQKRQGAINNMLPVFF